MRGAGLLAVAIVALSATACDEAKLCDRLETGYHWASTAHGALAAAIPALEAPWQALETLHAALTIECDRARAGGQFNASYLRAMVSQGATLVAQIAGLVAQFGAARETGSLDSPSRAVAAALDAEAMRASMLELAAKAKR